MPNQPWGAPPVVKHLRTRIPEWHTIKANPKSNDRSLTLATFFARVVHELDTMFANPADPLAIYGELQKSKKAKDGKDEPMTTYQAKVYKVSNWFPNNGNKGSDGRKDVLPVMKIKAKSAGIQHKYYIAHGELKPLLDAAFDAHKTERAAEGKPPLHSGAFAAKWKSKHWEGLDFRERQSFIDSTKTVVAAVEAAKSEEQKELERMENAHEHQNQVDKVVCTVNTFHTNLNKLTGAVTMTFVAYINPKLGGQPDIQVLSHGETIASGVQYPHYSPLMFNAAINDFRRYVNECFAYDDRVRLSLSPCAISTQVGSSIITGASKPVGKFINPANTFMAPAVPGMDGVSMQPASTNIAATQGNAQAQEWQMRGELDGMSGNGNVAVQPPSIWSHSVVDPQPQPAQESWMAWSGSAELLCLDDPLSTTTPPPRFTDEQIALLNEALAQMPTPVPQTFNPPQHFYNDNSIADSFQELLAPTSINQAVLASPPVSNPTGTLAGNTIPPTMFGAAPEQLPNPLAPSPPVANPTGTLAGDTIPPTTFGAAPEPLPRLPNPSALSPEPLAPRTDPSNIPKVITNSDSAKSAAKKTTSKPRWSIACSKRFKTTWPKGVVVEENVKMAEKWAELESYFLQVKGILNPLPLTSLPSPLSTFILTNGSHDILPVKVVERVPEGSTVARQCYEEWLVYWRTLQPSSRAAADGGVAELPKRINPALFSEWSTLCCGGPKGLSLVILYLSWWFENLDFDNIPDCDLYTGAVEDIVWVLDRLIEGGAEGKITWAAELGEEAEKENSSRGTKRAAAANAASLLANKRAREAKK